MKALCNMDAPNASFPLLHTFVLTAGIGLVLALASVIGLGLKIAVAKRQPHAVIDNLNTRVHAWWVICIVVGLSLAAGRIGVTLLFAFASFFALREYLAPALERRGERPLMLVLLLLVLPLQYMFIASGNGALSALFIPLLTVVALPALAVLAGKPLAATARTPTLRWLSALMICVWCVSQAPALLDVTIDGYEGRNAFLLVFLILVVQSCDVLQYLWGKLAGRRKIAPVLSPAKTVEGAVGGIASATLLGAALSPITPFTVIEAALISLTLTLLGLLGGLILSAQKRERGIKDWGTLIPGHGGVLDRLDSLFLSAPVFLGLVRIGWAS